MVVIFKDRETLTTALSGAVLRAKKLSMETGKGYFVYAGPGGFSVVGIADWQAAEHLSIPCGDLLYIVVDGLSGAMKCQREEED